MSYLPPVLDTELWYIRLMYFMEEEQFMEVAQQVGIEVKNMEFLSSISKLEQVA